MSLFAPISMPVPSLTSSPFANSNGLGAVLAADPNNQTPAFSQTLQNALGHVNDLQNRAGEMTRAYASGQTANVHGVMSAGEQAAVALQITAQIRNKVVEAYQEIMRISM